MTLGTRSLAACERAPDADAHAQSEDEGAPIRRRPRGADATVDAREGEIREAIAAGRHRRAVELIRAVYGRSIHQFACRMLDDPFAAEDVVQETLLRVYQSLPTLRTDSSLRAGVMTIAAHRALDELRRRTRQRRRVLHVDDLPEVPDARPPAPQLIDAHREARVLEACLDALPARARASVVMYFGQELTFDQVGATLGEKGGTVQVRVGRALLRLRPMARRRGLEPRSERPA